ncbi:MAG TPA: ParB/RepB/Spo0J family partition protein [Pyrinomonadaceae bacterium]|nr:ParB/RepB/Spo0J family partition protein [Pyrinomonadaceae bacterium]
MRHDTHYVEELAGQRPTPIGRLIPLEQIDPNPRQPRVEVGDLSELTASIADRGVLEPLLVKPSEVSGRWMIIAGERRWRAARAAGLREVPCIEMDVDERTVAEIALIENLQRKDLTPWEEADGLLALCERYGYTHDDVAKKVGKSRSTVTEALSIAALPEEIREECRRADINVKSTLLQIVRQPDTASMRRMVSEIARKGLTRDGARAARRQQIEGPSAPRPFVFKRAVPSRGATVEVRFSRPDPKEADVLELLRDLIAELEAGRGSDNEDG